MDVEPPGATPAASVDSLEFLARLKGLEPDAIELVYQMYGPAILRYAYRQTGDWARAQDVASEAFVRLLESIGRYQPRGVPLVAWLYRVARNLVIDEGRRQRRWTLVPLQEAPEAGAEGPEFSADIQDLAQALADLSAEQRQVLLLRFREGLSGAQVAQILGRSESAIRSLQHRALETLRRRLEAGGG